MNKIFVLFPSVGDVYTNTTERAYEKLKRQTILKASDGQPFGVEISRAEAKKIGGVRKICDMV